jgi:hypothetical protein
MLSCRTVLLEVISDDMSKSSRFVKKSLHGKCRRSLADSGDISPLNEEEFTTSA